MIRNILILMICSLLFSLSAAALEPIPEIGESGPVGQPLTGVGITSGDDAQPLVSCIETCAISCGQNCETQACAMNCGQFCADKCLSGAGITVDTPTVNEPDIAGYCAEAATCDACRNRPAYRCLWSGAACVPCTGPSCTFACNYVPKPPVTTITNIVDDGPVDEPPKLKVEGEIPFIENPDDHIFREDPETGNLIYVGPKNATNDTVTQMPEGKDTTKDDSKEEQPEDIVEEPPKRSFIASGFARLKSFFSWLF